MNRLRREPSPGTSTTAATTTSRIAARTTSERRSRDGENSSGSGSASTSTGSRYSTVKLGRPLMERVLVLVLGHELAGDERCPLRVAEDRQPGPRSIEGRNDGLAA